MATFHYKAVDNTGRELSGFLRADSTEAVEERLSSLDLFPLEILESAPRGIFLPFLRRGVSMRLMIDFTSSMGTVVGSGMSLLEGLKAIGSQLRSPSFSKILDDIVRAVGAGETFARALSYHPEIFPEFYVNVIRAGEEGGKLQMVLEDLTRLLENQEEIRSRIKEALVYPTFILGALFVMIVIFMTFVLPKLFGVIKELGVPIPPLTAFIIALSSFMEHWWYLVLPAPLVIVYLFRYLSKLPGADMYIDNAKLQLPVIGAVVWMTSVARFARYLSIFNRAGILITQGLALTSKVIGNAVVSKDIMEVRDRVLEGVQLSKSFEQSKIIPPMMVLMTRVGEEAGELEKMLTYVADYYDREANKAIKRALTLLEPTVILIMAVFVGISLAAVILPIYSIYQYIK